MDATAILRQLIIGISDQGIGIPPDDLPKLFQSFQRLDVQKKI